MGFLNNSTANIILDAVLTNKGRELLANGVGNFSISKFAFADDEVDYGIIKEFGRTVGKEKIEKNTPVLEAPTLGYLGLKYRNLSLNNNSLSTLPILSLTSTATDNTVTMVRNASSETGDEKQTYTAQWSQTVPAGTTCDVDCTDFSFRVTMDHLFLRIQGKVPDSVDLYNNATYTINSAGSLNSDQTSNGSMTIVAQGVGDTTFNQYSHSTSGTAIVSRVVTVSGYNSGQTLSFNVNIK